MAFMCSCTDRPTTWPRVSAMLLRAAARRANGDAERAARVGTRWAVAQGPIGTGTGALA